MRFKVIVGLLAVFLLLLQGRLWFGDGSIREVKRLQHEVHLQENAVDFLSARNAMLEEEVQDLKHRLGALEEKARTDLGMVKKGEQFYQVMPEGGAS